MTTTTTTHTFVVLDDDAYFTGELVCVVGATTEQVGTVLAQHGWSEWTEMSDSLTWYEYRGDVDEWFGDHNPWFLDHNESDYATPWDFASAATEGTGQTNDYAGALTLDALVGYLTTGNYPDHV